MTQKVVVARDSSKALYGAHHKDETIRQVFFKANDAFN